MFRYRPHIFVDEVTEHHLPGAVIRIGQPTTFVEDMDI